MECGYTEKDIVSIICVVNNSAELGDEDNCAINESIRNILEILNKKQNLNSSCEVKVSVIALAGTRRILANNVLLEDAYWDDLKPDGDAKWDELSECLDELLFDYLSHTLCDSMITRPIILFFTTTASIPTELSIDLNQSVQLKHTVLKYVVTPEDKWCDIATRIVDNNECIVQCDDEEKFKKIFNFAKMVHPLSDRLPNCLESEVDANFNGEDTEWFFGTEYQITYPAKSNVIVKRKFDLYRCQLMSCMPQQANEIILKLENEGNHLLVTNVSDLSFVATLKVNPMERRTIPHDITDVFEIFSDFSKEGDNSLNIKLDFDNLGYVSITNNTNYEIGIRHTLGTQGMFLRRGDFVTFGQGTQVLKIDKDETMFGL